MHPIIANLFKKRGIKDTAELSPDEKEDYRRWESILSAGEVTVASITEFIKQQLRIVDGQMKNLDNTPQKTERLVLLRAVYSTLFEAITAPKVEREALEKYLNDLLHK